MTEVRPGEALTPHGLILPRGFETKSDRTQQYISKTITAVEAESKFRDFLSFEKAVQLPWVFACVSLVAYSFANNEWDLYLKDKLIDDPKDPVMQLLHRPNPRQSGFSFMELFAVYMELLGEAYISLEERDGYGKPRELYLPNPARMRVIPDPKNYISAYAYEVGANNWTNINRMSSTGYRFIHYDPDEIIQFKFPNPMDDYRGFGNVEAAQSLLDIVSAMSDQELAYWRSGGRIIGVLETDEKVSDEDFLKIKQEWQAFSSDKRQRYKIAILEQGLKYQPISEGLKSLDLVGIDKGKRDQILAVFGIPLPKLGIMENAAYKQEDADRMFWCFTAGTSITTFTGPKPIEDIAVGDEVLTHQGRWRPVVEKWHRDYVGEFYEIEVSGNEESVTCTAEHPFYVQRDNGDREWVEALRLRVGDEVLGPRLQGSEDRVFKAVEVAGSKNGRGPRLAQQVEITEDIAWLIGLYIADGHLSRRGNHGIENPDRIDKIDLSLGTHEVDLITKARLVMATLGATSTRANTRGCTTVTGGVVAAQIMSNAGSNAYEKHIPSWLLNGPKNLLQSCFAGYWAGDGYKATRTAKDGDVLGASTVSVRLSHDLKIGLARLSLVANVYKVAARERVVNGQDSHASESFHVRLTGEMARTGAVMLGEAPFLRLASGMGGRPRGNRVVDTQYVAAKIQKITKTVSQQVVYNFEVEEDHTYTAQSFCARNSETMWPKFRRFEDQLQPLLDLYDPDYRLEFERKNFEDDSVKLANAKVMQGLYCYSSNQLLAYTGAPTIGADGEVIWIPNNMIPVRIDHISDLADRDEEQAKQALAQGAAAANPGAVPPGAAAPGSAVGAGANDGKPKDSTPNNLAPNHAPVGQKPPTVRGRPPGGNAAGGGAQANGRATAPKPNTTPNPVSRGAAKLGTKALDEVEQRSVELDKQRQHAAARHVASRMRSRGAKAYAGPMGRVRVLEVERQAKAVAMLPRAEPVHRATEQAPLVGVAIQRKNKKLRADLEQKYLPHIRGAFKDERTKLVRLISKLPKKATPEEAKKLVTEAWDPQPLREAVIALRIEGGVKGFRQGLEMLPPKHLAYLHGVRKFTRALDTKADVPADFVPSNDLTGLDPESALVIDPTLDDPAITDALLNDPFYIDALTNPYLSDADVDPALIHALGSKALDAAITALTLTVMGMAGDTAAEGVRRGYSPVQILAGTDEGYGGLESVFDSAMGYMSETIVMTESGRALNEGAVIAYREGGVKQVVALDGEEWDDECLPAGQLTVAPGTKASVARWFEGNLVHISTENKDLLSVTPNHPVLSQRGWARADELEVGDYVLRCSDPDRVARLVVPGLIDEDYRPTEVEKAADLAAVAGGRFAVRKRVVADHLYGKAIIWSRKVDAPVAKHVLSDERLAELAHELIESGLVRRELAVPTLQQGVDLTERLGASAAGSMGGASVVEALLGGQGDHAEHHGLGGAAHGVAMSFEGVSEVGGGDSEVASDGVAVFSRAVSAVGSLRVRDHVVTQPQPSREERGFDPRFAGTEFGSGLTDAFSAEVQSARVSGVELCAIRDDNAVRDQSSSDTRVAGMEYADDLHDGFAAEIQPTRISGIERCAFEGQVYNLETSSGWYIAQGIIVHNCRERNGKTFDLNDTNEPVDDNGDPVRDHPRGTLAFGPLEDLNLDFTGDLPPDLLSPPDDGANAAAQADYQDAIDQANSYSEE